ncbi:hypothetical protein SAMN06272735_8595 [Streptomyces sp. TLI_55]|nr:hypothetical protein SAMN06272735_8595 [Streptomyces sp. TLI_55]
MTAWRVELAIKSAEIKEPTAQVNENQAHLPGVE